MHRPTILALLLASITAPTDLARASDGGVCTPPEIVSGWAEMPPDVVLARITARIELLGTPYFRARVHRAYAGCSTRGQWLTLTGAASPDGPGVGLAAGDKVVLAGTATPGSTGSAFMQLEPCQLLRPFGSLTEAERSWLDARRVCCGDSCYCAASLAACPDPVDPCFAATCDAETGACATEPRPAGAPCDDDDPCTVDGCCQGGLCHFAPQNPSLCPDDMVPVEGTTCIDQYEASRPDATATSAGTSTALATSRSGVRPWFPVTFATAQAACAAAGKRLCTAAELYQTCAGPEGHVYVYGDTYSADTCNGIDAFCDCASPQCAGLDLCPYPHCRSKGPTGVYGDGCGAMFHVAPTGSFPGCVNTYGAYDITGNVWELADAGDGQAWFMGGAYNCGNSEVLHRCIQLRKDISAKGFRCCRDPFPAD